MILPEGELTHTATHVYQDDNPSATPSDVYPVTVIVNGSNCQTYTKQVQVNNLDPS